jgi:signal transduction histidine kinase
LEIAWSGILRLTMKKKYVQDNNVSLSSFPQANKVPAALSWILMHQWWMLILAAILLISFEVYDFSHDQSALIYVIETIIFLVLLWVIGLLLASLSRGFRNQSRIINILDAKHKLSMEFSGYHEWDVLVNQIAKFPGTLVGASQSCLFVSNIITNQFDMVAQWSQGGKDVIELCVGASCQECFRNQSGTKLAFFQSVSEPLAGGFYSQAYKYCLAIKDEERLLAVLQFVLEPGQSLTVEQVDIFRNISDDIAVALKAVQDRQVLQEMLTSETALAERRSVSHYLHDHLGQSLGYLHLKMDQLLTNKGQLSLDTVLEDLELMRNAADESYGIVRGVLETMRPETTQTLTNLLLEYARKLSQRANFKLDFKTSGKPVLLPEQTQSAAFYAFEELLSNVEKHAMATRVTIRADWSPGELSLSISDNGVGFDTQGINSNRHFGLEILNERMAMVNGHVTFIKMEKSGTVANILVPVSSQSRLGTGS